MRTRGAGRPAGLALLTLVLSGCSNSTRTYELTRPAELTSSDRAGIWLSVLLMGAVWSWMFAWAVNRDGSGLQVAAGALASSLTVYTWGIVVFGFATALRANQILGAEGCGPIDPEHRPSSIVHLTCTTGGLDLLEGNLIAWAVVTIVYLVITALPWLATSLISEPGYWPLFPLVLCIGGVAAFVAILQADTATDSIGHFAALGAAVTLTASALIQIHLLIERRHARRNDLN